MGLPHSVKFMNDLSVEIQELGRDLDFDNLSRGERNRLILSLELGIPRRLGKFIPSYQLAVY